MERASGRGGTGLLLVVHRSIRFPICGAIVTGVFLRAHTMREERCVRVFVCVRFGRICTGWKKVTMLLLT